MMPGQGPQVRREPILAALADLLLMVNDLGQIVDTVADGARTAFQGEDGRLPWDRDPSITVGKALFGEGHKKAVQFDLNFQQLVDGFLPAALLIDQLPSEVHRDGRSFELAVSVLAGVEPFAALVRLVDITDQAEERERAKGDHEFRHVMEQLMSNVEASRSFFGETRWLLGQIGPDDDNGKLARDLHTLKGNLACFGFDALAGEIHKTEDLLLTGDRAAVYRAIDDIRSDWEKQERTFGSMFASRADREVMISREEYEEVVMLCMMQADYTELLGEVQRWAMDPVSRVFERLAVQAKRTSQHLGKTVTLVAEHNNVRLPGTGLHGLWTSLVHVVRNAVDHGIETPAEREAVGKRPAGTFTMRAELDDEHVTLAFIDDGAGLDWEALRASAERVGLPHDTHDDLVQAMLSAGVSTKGTASEHSGRGVGTSAVLEEVRALGGHVDVTSERGQGTTFSLKIPLARLATLGLLS